MSPEEPLKPTDFIRDAVVEDLKSKRFATVHTRFPPEPNGYLHIGHAKAICIDFGIAQEFGGKCNLRFDDTNPTKEDVEYVDAIKEDIHWLGFDWAEREYYASDYFEQLYELAIKLIKKDNVFVLNPKYQGKMMKFSYRLNGKGWKCITSVCEVKVKKTKSQTTPQVK